MVTVVVPVLAQDAALLPRALASLRAQRRRDWECVVVTPDDLEVPAWARVVREREARGLGAACNAGLAAARGSHAAYLPADDVWFAGHLDAVAGHDAALAVLDAPESRVRLVQLVHRVAGVRWRERGELETDDHLAALVGLPAPARLAGEPTCRAEDHPRRRTRALRGDLDGGPATFRARYGVRGPLRLPGHDEARRADRVRGRRPPPEPADALRVLLVGELAYNPERILALEERGCRLYGLWIDDPLGFMTVGPLPFGHVEDVPRREWRSAVRRIRPHVAYGLLNWRAVPLVHHVLHELPELPLVWHLKEAPQRAIARGEWGLLADVERRAAARAYVTPEQQAWFDAVLPLPARPTAVVDGDPPPREWLAGPRQPARDPARTALLGRPYGFDDGFLARLARRGVRVERPSAEPPDWVRVLGGYAAGWLHPVAPDNHGELLRATWDDLNLPARLPTLLAAGLPLLAPAADGHVRAVARIIEEHGCGLLYRDADDLADRLGELDRARERAWAVRERFTFDAQADRLLALLRAVARP